MLSQVYGFCDAQGEFHGFEGPEGRRLVMAMKALEEKILSKVDMSLVPMRRDIEQTNAKLGNQVIPTLQKLGKEMISNERYLCDKVDELSMEAFHSRSDLLIQIDEINREAMESRADLLAALEELETRLKLDKDMTSLEIKANDSSAAIKNLEDLEMQLDKDIAQASRELDSTQQEDLGNLQAEVCALDQKEMAACRGTAAPSSQAASTQGSKSKEEKHSAMDLDMSSWHSSKEEMKLDFSLQLSKDIFSSGASGGALYSSKMTPTPPNSVMFAKKSMPFAHGFNMHRPRPLARMTSSSSTPLLAPL